MAARKNPRLSRETIEKIRATIDTRAAIQELHKIGHDDKIPAGVRVKALSVLVDKTLPSLTEKDITHTIEHVSPVESMRGLIAILGEAQVMERWPDLYERFQAQPRVLEHKTIEPVEQQ